jgi:hypothetical protein
MMFRIAANAWRTLPHWPDQLKPRRSDVRETNLLAFAGQFC